MPTGTARQLGKHNVGERADQAGRGGHDLKAVADNGLEIIQQRDAELAADRGRLGDRDAVVLRAGRRTGELDVERAQGTEADVAAEGHGAGAEAGAGVAFDEDVTRRR